MWIDTHCHLDADEFEADRDAVVERARASGVDMLVIPTGHVADYAKAAAIAQRYGFAYAVGVHPLWIEGADEDDVERLREIVQTARSDRHFVAIGEIGIDCFEPGDVTRQEWFFHEQLRVARDNDLPVIVHAARCRLQRAR